jgi:hypothetical protein
MNEREKEMAEKMREVQYIQRDKDVREVITLLDVVDIGPMANVGDANKMVRILSKALRLAMNALNQRAYNDEGGNERVTLSLMAKEIKDGGD